MAKYRKLPVMVEAEHVYKLLNMVSNDWNNLPEWVKENNKKGNIVFLSKALLILTSGKRVYATYNDYLVKDENGEIYPCNHNIFERTHERIK